MRTFVELRKWMQSNKELSAKIELLEKNMINGSNWYSMPSSSSSHRKRKHVQLVLKSE